MKIALMSPSGIMYRKGGIFPTALRYAPLTLTTLAGLVPDEFDADITLYDEAAGDIPLDVDADIIGISAITGTSNRAYAYADHFRSQGKTVILGGVHPTLLPNEAKQHADSIVTGMAYTNWPKLLQDFTEGNLQEHYAQRGKMDLSGLPEPKRKLLGNTYISKASIQATYGCPYTCDFCAVSATNDNYLRRPIDDVIEELENMKGSFVVFVDPSPTENKKYIKELWREMIPLKKKWGGLATVKIANDPELMDLAAESGCKGLLLGFEDVSQSTVEGINKGFNQVNDYKRVASELHQRGIAINGTFMFGMDGQNEDSFKRTVDFVNEAKIDLPRYAIYTPFPGTPVFHRLEQEGRILTRNWALYDAQHVTFQPKGLTPDQVVEGQLWAWDQTYRAGSIMHRIMKRHTSSLMGLIGNLGYKYYSKGLGQYDNETMVGMQEAWDPKVQK
jgi:radical SAM superfamily enzyme YgiQ (UPF0313 family)